MGLPNFRCECDAVGVSVCMFIISLCPVCGSIFVVFLSCVNVVYVVSLPYILFDTAGPCE